MKTKLGVSLPPPPPHPRPPSLQKEILRFKRITYTHKNIPEISKELVEGAVVNTTAEVEAGPTVGTYTAYGGIWLLTVCAFLERNRHKKSS